MLHLRELVANSEEERLYDLGTGLEWTIPSHIAKSLPMKCECGFEYQTNYKLTQWFCPNPYCHITLAYKAFKAFEKLHNRINIGFNIACDIIKYNRFHRHIDLICINNPRQFPSNFGVERVENWILALEEIRKDISLSDYISLFQFDKLGSTSCGQMFAGQTIQSLEELVGNENRLRIHIRDTLKLRSHYSDTENSIVSTLKLNMHVIKHYSNYFTFKVESTNIITFSITGSLSEFSSRTDLLPYLEEHYDILPRFSNSYSSKVDYLIYEVESESRKMVQAKKSGKAIHINDFLKMLEPYRKYTEEG